MSPMASSVVPRASLLGLPLELRDQIYYYYFKADGGYVSDGDKLLQASGQTVQISLILACRSIASETRHLPFTLNPITFSTEPSPEYSQYMPIVMEEVAEFIRIWDRRTELSTEVRNSRAFVDAQQFRDGAGSRVGVPSIRLRGDDSTVALKRTRSYLLRQLADKHPAEFSQAIEEILPGWNDSYSIDEFFNLGFDSWAMPTRSEVRRMANLMQNTKYWQNGDAWYYLHYGNPGYNGPKYRYKRKYWFSAAAQAIRFLGLLSRQQRLLISKLILNEDRPAAAFPESHMIGMVPFCLENPKLHVEHRLNLWRNILARGDDYRIRSLTSHIEAPPLVFDDTPDLHQIVPGDIGEAFTRFILHLLEAMKEGLPSDSYSLIVSGYPGLDRATEVFSASMKPYIAWLTANMTDCIAYRLVAPSSHHEYPFPTRNSTGGVAPVSERSAIIQCDFTLDQPWDWEKIYDESEVSTVSTLDRLSIFSMGHSDDFLDVTTDVLDWESILRESYEMEELSEGLFAEPYNDRYLA
ncbi:uncharacterized protein FPRO_11759 [Fusarium proliferatum ET1]|uniref:Uncharacterized protein n=1 Tax=Fusarium proliferatum (strain ET1) TaxID=1227346 RepID=A0A1L7W213_FUSPR|nr:uncharacterized protein FPRO_11759 [Fusarium proliferatum ET1]CZR46311.1 uncharacterized protein FPRO_11759 [Fusarium proliferatum ET1]